MASSKSSKIEHAKLEIFHSRPVVPTRRIALGKLKLNETRVNKLTDLTLGGLLLAAIAGRYASSIHPDLWEDMEILIHRIQTEKHIPQPCMRFRLQSDKIGLARSSHTLTKRANGKFEIEFASHSKDSSVQQILGALYATRTLQPNVKASTIDAIRIGLSWWGTASASLIDYILDSDRRENSLRPKSWALELLDIDNLNPSGAEVQRHFRQKLWSIHPDRGGDPMLASDLIQELAEARRVLLSTD